MAVLVHAVLWPVVGVAALLMLLDYVLRSRRDRHSFDRIPLPLALVKLSRMRLRLWRKNLFPLFPVVREPGPAAASAAGSAAAEVVWTRETGEKPGSLELSPRHRTDERPGEAQQAATEEEEVPSPGGRSRCYYDLSQPDRFGRNFFPASLRAERPHKTLYAPSPAVVSDRLLARRGGHLLPATGLNYLAAAWIQFQAHNMVGHHEGDSARLEVRRDLGWTAPATRMADPLPGDVAFGRCPVFRNRGSAEWDASQLYGRGPRDWDQLRERRGGRLLVDAGPGGGWPRPLPAGGPGDDSAWAGTELLRWLFAMEHNAVCRELEKRHPLMEDEPLFQTARRVVTAVMAKIHTLEWMRAALDSPLGATASWANWRGLCRPCGGCCVPHGRGAAGGVGCCGSLLHGLDPLLGGVRGGPHLFDRAPLFATEELVSVLRLHTMARDSLPVPPLPGRAGAGQAEEQVPAEALLGAAAAQEQAGRLGRLRLVSAMGNCHPGAAVLHNYPDFLRRLRVGGAGSRAPELQYDTDLAALDLLRDRERAVPRFNAFREGLGLRPLHSFEQFEVDRETLDEMRDVYGDDLDRVDTLVGLLAERRPEGHLLGNTAFLLLSAMSARRLAASSLLTDDYHEGSFTAAGMAWIEGATLSSVLMRHLPGVGTLLHRCGGNAFRPWRTASATDPEELEARALRQSSSSSLRASRQGSERDLSVRRGSDNAAAVPPA